MPAIPAYFQRDVPQTSRLDQDPSQPTAALPIRRHKYPNPKLRLQLNDLSHEGSSIFLSNVKGAEDIETQVQNVLNLLYGAERSTSSSEEESSSSSSSSPTNQRPGTRSVTFVLRPMDGVAYTTGIDLDHDHKEIHINLNYIRQVARNNSSSGHQSSYSGTRDEILGVICHELVHCFQWAAEGTAPGGLIEGVADWVRLRAGLAAKHWKREAKGKQWDAGYQTTGFFLDWLEGKFGEGTVRKINAQLRGRRWDEERVFGEACRGKKVGDLWEEYKDELGEKDEKSAVKDEGVDEEKDGGGNGNEAIGSDE